MKIVHEKLYEYLTQEGVSLLKYFSQTDEEKKSYLPHMYSFKFKEFDDLLDDYEDYEIADILQDKYPDVYQSFADSLFDKINRFDLNIPDSEYPAWSYFDDPKLIKNQWLIHMCNDSYKIAREGFKYGVDEVDKLGLTTHLGQFEKKYGGYNFAYTLYDFKKYGKDRDGYKYGDEAVIFRASGVRLWHHGDEEYQTIFYGNTAKNIIPIDSYEGEYRITGDLKTLYKSEKIEDIAYWLDRNYDQYRKQFKK